MNPTKNEHMLSKFKVTMIFIFSLSAQHDGESGNSCSFSDQYIMAASSSPQTNAATATHPWIFSTCSTTYFSNYIDSLEG